MAKFALNRFPAGFFDITQDIAAGLPVDLIEQWTRSDQSAEAAFGLLSPFEVEGTVLCTDSCGLTRMSSERPLLEMLDLISEPKEIVQSHVKAIGGRAVGVWAADNSESFFDASVGVERVLATLLRLRDEIRERCAVQLGMCVHHAKFYDLIGGLYGPEADIVEFVAEVHASAGEVLISRETAQIAGDGFRFAACELADISGQIMKLDHGPAAAPVAFEGTDYPIPFSREFFEDLLRYRRGGRKQEKAAELSAKWFRRKAVVLLERESEEPDVPQVAVLTNLALSGAMAKIGTQLLQEYLGQEIKTAGAVGIYVFNEALQAVEFARSFRERFLEQSVAMRVGIDVGDVLISEVEGGGLDIAGMPVNVASKISQDTGEFGSIYLSEAVAAECGCTEEMFPSLVRHISGVSLKVYIT